MIRQQFSILRSCLGACLAGAVILAPELAHAGRCIRGSLFVRMPLAITTDVGDFATTPSACPFGSIYLDIHGQAMLATAAPNFYGRLVAEGTVGVTVPLSRELWLSGSFTPLRYEFAQNVSVVGTSFGTGATTIAMHVAAYRRGVFQFSPYVRVRLPTDMTAGYVVRTGVDPGASAMVTFNNRVAMNIGVAFPLAVDWIGTNTRMMWSFRGSLDLMFTPADWFELILGAETRVNITQSALMQSSPLEYIAPKLGLRFIVGRTTYIQLAGLVPFGGTALSELNALARVNLTVGSAWQ